MTLSAYERRLKECNPKLRIRRIRDGMANVCLGTGNRPIARVDTGELTVYNQFIFRSGLSDQYKTDFNPSGAYKYKYMIKRGRAELARVLYTERVINHRQISKLSN